MNPASGERLWPLAVAIFVLMLPVTAVVPALEELTGGRHPELSDFDKHLFMVANMLAALIFAPLAGRLSDRSGRRKPIILGAMLANALVLVLLAQDAPYAVHLALRFADGALHITALTLLMTLAMDRSVHSGTGRAMGTAGAAVTLGVATGAPVGGLVAETGAVNVLFAGAGLSLLLAAWVAGLTDRVGAPERTQRPTWSELPLRRLAAPYVFTFADRLSVGFIISTVTLYLRTVLEAQPAQIGMLMGAFMLPFALLTYPFGRLARRVSPLWLMMAGSAAYGGILIALALAPLPLWWLLMPLGGISAAAMFAPSLVLTAQAAGTDQRGTAMGGFHAAGSLGFLLGPLVGGGILALASVLDRPGWFTAFVAVAVLQWLCVALFLPAACRHPKPSAQAEVGRHP